MKNLAKSTIALIAAGLVIAALAGALIATALSGDDDDRDDDDRIALQTNEAPPQGRPGTRPTSTPIPPTPTTSTT